MPVNISYTRILERNFVKNELMVSVLQDAGQRGSMSYSTVQGGVKKPETVMEAVKGAWSILTGHVGDVRVDFAQPFSMQVFLIGPEQWTLYWITVCDTGVLIKGSSVRVLSSRAVSIMSPRVNGQPVPDFSS